MATTRRVPADYPTITVAIAAANPYDTIRVAPGTYNETVIINKTIQLLGAQAGNDARARVTISESIVTSNDISGAIQVNADNAVVDGFTVSGNTLGPGIHSSEFSSGYWIFNNIVKDNSYGIFVDSSGQTFTQVKKNLLFNNNIFGNGVYSQVASNVYIDSNKFAGQHNSASINLADGGGVGFQQNMIISNNLMVNDNSIALTNTTNIKITQNTMLNTQGSSIFIGGGNDRTEIERNILHDSTSVGINVTTAFTGTPNSNIRAKNNSIQGNAIAGLKIDAGAYTVSPRRLDATNNYWGSPTGPSGAGPGTGDAVIDPDSVSEFVPFLIVDPFPPVVKNLSTGPVQRAGTDAQTITVQLLNDDPSTTAIVEILGFYKSGSTKLPYVHELFSLAPNEIITKNYFVTQTDVFEFQFGIRNTTAVLTSIWGVDSMGRVIAHNRLAAEELVTIPLLTPGVP